MTLNYNSYNVRSDSGPSSIQSIISHPEDITVQPASESGPGNMGHFLNIGAIGLWTLDREATLVKYGDELQTANIDLYNVADISKNPVFRLFSKKTFLPGGLKIDTGTGTHTDYLTISWSIKF